MRMIQIARGRTATAILIAGLLCILSGCQTATARRVSTGTFDQIQPGVTTAAWLRTNFGEPATKQRTTEHAECWGWVYRTQRNTDGSYSVLFYGPDEAKSDGRGWAYAELTDGVLVRLTMADPKANFGGEWAEGTNVRTGNATHTMWLEWHEPAWVVR